jgi:DNA-binding transcriptional ArsR family regulator
MESRRRSRSHERNGSRPVGLTLAPSNAVDCLVALKALGEETRVRIVGLLIDQPLEVSEISHQLGVSPYNVSKHLRILREAGLLERHKHGRQHRYALREDLRRRAANGRVLDLGCCSFRFDGPQPS